MKTFFQVLKFYTLRSYVYPLEVISTVIKRLLYIAFLTVFWGLYVQSSNQNLNLTELIGYFLIAGSIADLTLVGNTELGRVIRHDIKYSRINTVLIRPLNLIPFYYARSLGNLSVRNLIGVVFIILGIALNPPKSILGIIFFIIYIVIAALISISYNMIEGSLALIFTEVSGIKNALNHMTRVLSGLFIPLTLFPENIRNVLLISPFQYMIFAPINALKIQTIDIEVLKNLAIGIFWALIMNIFIFKFWKFCLSKFEASGI